MKSFDEFWPYYLSEHRNSTSRRLHFIGTVLALIAASLAIFVSPWIWIAVPVSGYAFAWTGHFFFEKNRPATFRYPLWSLAADFRMFLWLLTGRDLE